MSSKLPSKKAVMTFKITNVPDSSNTTTTDENMKRKQLFTLIKSRMREVVLVYRLDHIKTLAMFRIWKAQQKNLLQIFWILNEVNYDANYWNVLDGESRVFEYNVIAEELFWPIKTEKGSRSALLNAKVMPTTFLVFKDLLRDEFQPPNKWSKRTITYRVWDEFRGCWLCWGRPQQCKLTGKYFV